MKKAFCVWKQHVSHCSVFFFFSTFPFPSSSFSAHREFSSSDHRAGSQGDEDLGNKIHSKFNEYNMKVWTDEHFVKVQDPPTKANSYSFRNKTEELDGFLSYSEAKTATVT